MAGRSGLVWWGWCSVALLAACLKPPEQPSGDAAGVATALQREAAQLRAEATALRTENALLRAQLLSTEPWGRTIQLATTGGLGGQPFLRMCTAGEAIVGMRGRSGAAMDAVGPVCGPIRGPEIPPGVEAGPMRNELDLAGGQGGSPYSLECPAGTVAVGMRGHSGNTVSGFRLVCRNPGEAAAPPQPARAEEGVIAEGTAAEGTGQGTGEGTGGGATPARRHHRREQGEATSPVGSEDGDAFVRICPPGWLAVGLSGRGGTVVDALSVICAPWSGE